MAVTVGLILTGGASERMGTNKGEVEVGGKPTWYWVASALESVVTEIWLGGAGLAGCKLPVVTDPQNGSRRGPLAGLVGAWDALSGMSLLAVGVDQPWVRTETLQALITAHKTSSKSSNSVSENSRSRSSNVPAANSPPPESSSHQSVTVVPVWESIRQTTCALYGPALQELAREQLNRGGSIQSLLEETPPNVLLSEPMLSARGEDGRSFFSVNYPTDIQAGLDRFGIPQG